MQLINHCLVKIYVAFVPDVAFVLGICCAGQFERIWPSYFL